MGKGCMSRMRAVSAFSETMGSQIHCSKYERYVAYELCCIKLSRRVKVKWHLNQEEKAARESTWQS